MTIRERKLILHFLEMLHDSLSKKKTSSIDPLFLKYFERKDLVKLVLYFNYPLQRQELADLNENELLNLIESDMKILTYVIQKWKEALTASPRMTTDEVERFFDEKNLETHYLRSKPSDEWDEYDRSNYYSLLLKHGKTRRVYVIHGINPDMDEFIAKPDSDFYFDTEVEALEELGKLQNEEGFKVLDLSVKSIWLLN